jgi:DNA-binding winged helix-turn-helix (wHTH) protein/tetratricopeptide (TPR) repeat protein
MYEFDLFRIDPRNRTLTRNEQPIPLAPLAFNALLFFVENRGKLLTKNELMTAIWPDTVVDDTNLAVLISTVRKALGDSGHAQKYIATVAKSGYRFVGEFQTAPPADARELALPDQSAPEGPNIRRKWWVIPRSPVLLSLGMSVVAVVCTLLFFPQRKQLFGGPISHSLNLIRPSGSRTSVTGISNSDAGKQASTVRALYLKGRYSWSRGTKSGLQQSITYFTKAIAEDPRNALAYAGLADAYGALATWSVQSSGVSYRKAREAAQKAVELDDSLSQAHAALGTVAMAHDWNFPLAEREFRRAVELGPHDAIAHQRLSRYLAATGKFQDALREARLASDLDPLSLNIGTTIGRILYYSRQYGEAIAEFQKLIELDPHYTQAHYDLSAVYVAQGDFDRATPELEETLRLNGNRDPLALGLYGMARAQSGDQTGAQEILSELLDRSQREFVSPVGMAMLYLGLDRKNEALDWIDRIFQDRMGAAVWAEVDPIFDSVRSQRRFVAQLRSVSATRSNRLPSLPQFFRLASR